jgi:hypothetical protein
VGEGKEVRDRAGAASDPDLPPSEGKNLCDDPVDVLKDSLIWKTEDREVQSFKIRVAFQVPGCALRVGVDVSVQFDQQLDLVTVEIRDERTDGELAPKFQAA